MKNYPESKQILEILSNAKNVLLMLHISPDSDSVGANLAFSAFLDSRNIKNQILSVDPPPNFLSFLEGVEKIQHKDPRDVIEDFDTLVFLDSATAARVTRHEHGIPLENKEVIVIDHHRSNEGFGKVNIIDIEASSTGEVLFNLFKEWNFDLKPVATYLLSAMSGDTGNFRFQTTPQTLSIASQLLEMGASLRDIDFNIYRRIPLKMLKYQAAVIRNLELVKAEKVTFAFSAMSEEDISKLGGEEYAQGGSEQTGNIEEVDFGVVIKEEPDGYIGGSFRARTDIDVSAIAALFGGGGHKAAAGFHTKVEGSFEDKKKQILDQIIRHLKS